MAVMEDLWSSVMGSGSSLLHFLIFIQVILSTYIPSQNEAFACCFQFLENEPKPQINLKNKLKHLDFYNF